MNESKSSGPDEIPPKLLKELAESGTAKQFADEAARCIAPSLKVNIKVVDLLDFSRDTFHELLHESDSVVIFILATYGDGEPTENARMFFQILKSYDGCLRGLKYVVFGLGDSAYLHYNAVAKFVDDQLSTLGACRLHELTLGDAANSLEAVFAAWQSSLISSLAKHFGLRTPCADDTGLKSVSVLESAAFFEHITAETAANLGGVFTGEPEILDSFKFNAPPFSAKNPFLSPVIHNDELYAGDYERSCRLIELDISTSGFKYAAGDHLAVLPRNSSSLVNQLCALLKVDPEQLVHFSDSVGLPVKTSFPTPCSYRTAFTHYFDITSPPRFALLRKLAAATSSEAERDLLRLLASGTEAGNKKYEKWFLAERRHLVDLLEDLSSCRPVAKDLLSVLPRLQPRYYSIASSPRLFPDRVHLVVAVVKYETSLGRLRFGVASDWLSRLPEMSSSHLVPVFLRRSEMRLPRNPLIPIIMIGPGTGLAPFRGFLQERSFIKSKGGRLGEAMLFFGCRHRSQDFLFSNELSQALATGVITDLQCAFSRDQPFKVYVQDKMLELSAKIWRLLSSENGILFLCGSAGRLVKDVQSTLLRIAQNEGGLSAVEADEFLTSLRASKRYIVDVWR
ncbi:hypothetical protein SprV_0100189500 [Sparganum proliferum]